jgi:hypothetical protein
MAKAPSKMTWQERKERSLRKYKRQVQNLLNNSQKLVNDSDDVDIFELSVGQLWDELSDLLYDFYKDPNVVLHYRGDRRAA